MDQRKRKKKQYFVNNAKKSRSLNRLEPGLKGFLCTCNKREKDCIRETYNILNEYADKLYGDELVPERVTGPQQPPNKKIIFKDSDDEDEDDDDDQGEDDIQSALAREVNALKEAHSAAPSQRRFQAIESGAKNCVFIRTTVDDPVRLVETILKDIELIQQQKTRFLLRLLPVETTCKAWPDDIKQASEQLLPKYFTGDPKTFCIIFNRRNNSNVPRDELIHQIAGDIKNLNPLHKADMKQPDLTIIVEVICSIVCLAVVPKYFYYRKYNLIEVSKPRQTSSSQQDAKGEAIIEKSLSNSEGICHTSSVEQRDDNKVKLGIPGEIEVTTENSKTIDKMSQIPAEPSDPLPVCNNELKSLSDSGGSIEQMGDNQMKLIISSEGEVTSKN